MKSSRAVALTARDRIDRVLGILAEEVGHRLLTNPRLANVTFSTRKGPIAVREASTRRIPLDPAECCKVILGAPAPLFGEIRESVAFIKSVRDRLAHPRRLIDEAEVEPAVSAVTEVLQHFGRTAAAREAQRFRSAPMIRYVITLRTFLIGVAARQEPLVSYEDALAAMHHATPSLKMSEFLRQLNVLATLQMILGEPQLCALVVLANSRIPGDGFFWAVGLTPSDTAEDKRAAHRREVVAVQRFKWSLSSEEHALPW